MDASDRTDLDDLVSRLPLASLAGRLGTDPASAEAAIRAALPALLGGMGANAQDPAGEASLREAVAQHRPADQLADVDLDEADGERITRHVFGDAQDEVVQRLGGVGGVDQGLVRKVLPLLAPLVLSYLGKRMGGAAGGAGASGGIGQIIESVLKGAGSPASAAGTSSGAASSIIDVLGGLLGSGRR